MRNRFLLYLRLVIFKGPLPKTQTLGERNLNQKITARSPKYIHLFTSISTFTHSKTHHTSSHSHPLHNHHMHSANNCHICFLPAFRLNYSSNRSLPTHQLTWILFLPSLLHIFIDTLLPNLRRTIRFDLYSSNVFLPLPANSQSSRHLWRNR